MAKSRRRPAFTPNDMQRIRGQYGPIKFYYPHQLSTYEDRLQRSPAQLPLEARITCGICKTTAPQEHIVEHSQNPDTPSMQRQRAAKNKTENIISDAQFTQTEPQ